MHLNIVTSSKIVNPLSTNVHPPAVQPFVLPKRQQIEYTFEPVPSGLDDEIHDPRLSKLYRVLLKYLRNGFDKPSLRLLSKKMRRSVRMVQRYLRGLVALGKLVITARKVARNYNEPNTYEIKCRGRGGDINVMEKKVEVLSTSTPTPAAWAELSQTRIEFEARKLANEQAGHLRRENYDLKKKMWAMMKGFRRNKTEEREAMALRAAVGMPTRWQKACDGARKAYRLALESGLLDGEYAEEREAAQEVHRLCREEAAGIKLQIESLLWGGVR